MTATAIDVSAPQGYRRVFFWRHHTNADVKMVWARDVLWDADVTFRAGEPVDLQVVDARMARRRFWAGDIALFRRLGS